MSKFEDTRIVTFKEDYGAKDESGKITQVYYKKGSKHAIHFKVVKKLEEKGAKMDVTTFDRKAFVAKEKEKRIKRDKSQISVERR